MQYKKDNCDSFGNVLDNNLSKKELKDLKNLKARIKNEGLICGETDKTGKLILDTRDNVKKKMKKHIQEDTIINEKKVKTLENKLNNHMESWTKILKPGEKIQQAKRVKSNLVTKDNQIPVLRGTSKDHKIAIDEEVGPDVRPIMGAIVGPNIGLSELGSIIVRKIAEKADVGLVIKSTEEALNKIENFNKSRLTRRQNLKKMIIASMDIEKYYPNILSLQSAKIIRRMWEELEMEMMGLEVDEICKYLGKHLKQWEVIEEGFEELLYTKKKKTRKVSKKVGNKKVKSKKVKKNMNKKVKETVKNNNDDIRSSMGADTQKAASKEDKTKYEVMDIDSVEGADTLETVETAEQYIDKSKKRKKQEWTKPKRIPTLIEQRNLFGKALEVMLVTCMDNHVYQFDNEIRVQKKGGPIGLKLTGEIADCVMIDWDQKFLKELAKLNLVPDVYTRFKDDIGIAVESLEKGSKLEGGKVVIDEAKRQMDVSKSDTKVTMEIIQVIANSINPMITLTVDTPCNYPDGKLPVLDFKVNVNEKENSRIDFEFYEKPTKNPMVVLASSALSNSQKRTILTQECLRRLRNTKVELGPEIQKKHLDKFMLKVKNSGYTTKFRREVLDSAQKAFAKMVDDDKAGVKPLYRSKDWTFDERQKAKMLKIQNWWNLEKAQIQYSSVLFVTPTPGGVLASDVRKREAEINKNSQERVKVVEKGGLKIKDILCTKNPFQKSNCSQKSCPLCANSEYVVVAPGDGRYPCNSNNVGYRWQCVNCEIQNKVKIYEGETSRSARIRGSEHVKDLERKTEKSVLYKHIQNEHPNEEVKFRMEITRKFRDALTRQANEAVRIFSRAGPELLNSKSEFNHPPLARVVVEKKKPWTPNGVSKKFK